MPDIKNDQSELLILDNTLYLPYRADTGPLLGAFFKEMRDKKKIWANKCPKCGRMRIPPESFCGRCWGVAFGENDWVEMGDEGTLEIFEIHYYEAVHPFTGKITPVPWANGLIKLDGGWCIEHYVEPADPAQHKIGDRYKAVWKEEGRKGDAFDILCFKKVEDATGGPKILPGNSPIPRPPAEPHFININMQVTYHHSAGKQGSEFLVTLRDEKKLLGGKCTQCNKVYMPPQSVCGECFAKIDEWVDLTGKGTLTSYTVVYQAEESQPAPVPLAYGIIQLDGADTGLTHLIGEVDFDTIRIGMRMEPVFKAKREGNMLDIKYFRPLR